MSISMKKSALLGILLASSIAQSRMPLDQDFFNVNFRAPWHRVQKHELLIMPSISFDGWGRSIEHGKIDPMQSLHSTQNAFAMLKGFAIGSDQEQLVQQFVNDEDGVRGHLNVTGKFSYKRLGLEYLYHWDHEWGISCSIPYCTATIENVTWQDQTKNITYEDAIMHSLVTDKLENLVQTLGGLKLGNNWSQVGFGDARLMAHWNRIFLQEKEWLKEVAIAVRFGLKLPTGRRKDEDVAYAYAFGNDGALGLPFGCGLDLKFKKFLHVGIDLGFEHVFNDTKIRRIVTDPLQTDLLMLQKAGTYKEHGVIQMFNLYIEPQLLDNVALRCAYQHIKKGNDKLYVIDNEYSSIIANKAANLKEWTTHNLFLQLRYDHKGKRGAIAPVISVFGQLPFNGKRCIQAPSIGFEVAFHF